MPRDNLAASPNPRYSESEGSLGHSVLLTPGLSAKPRGIPGPGKGLRIHRCAAAEYAARRNPTAQPR
jgi:hypothetical protein